VTRRPSVEVFVRAGCPHGSETIERVREAVAALDPDWPVQVVELADEATGQGHGLRGLPTVRVGGEEVRADERGATPIACQRFGSEGAPAPWMVEAVLLKALAPRHILFMCVANSARSQLAEGIARSLAPEGVKISSAGSAPTAVRPEAIAVLREIGLDITGHHSKAVADIDASSVDAVITLCSEEVCPVFLGKVYRLHWGLPDPAKVEGEARLEAFRQTRDELRSRLQRVFG
jgi:arsenate reductase